MDFTISNNLSVSNNPCTLEQNFAIIGNTTTEWRCETKGELKISVTNILILFRKNENSIGKTEDKKQKNLKETKDLIFRIKLCSP